jgi:hypothetical protein
MARWRRIEHGSAAPESAAGNRGRRRATVMAMEFGGTGDGPAALPK